MFNRAVHHFKRFRSWYSISRDHFVVRLGHWAISLGVLAASLGFIVRQIFSGYTTVSVSGIHLDVQRLVLSWLCIMTSTLLGAWEWVLLVHALGGHLSLRTGVRIHMVSNLSKYMPGLVWPYASKAYLAIEHGVPASVATLSIAVEFVIVYIGGILLMLLSLPFSGIMPWSAGQSIMLQVVAFVIAVTSISLPSLAGPRLWARIWNNFLPNRYVKDINWRNVTFVILAVTLTWYLLGFGFYMLEGSVSLALQNPLRLMVALPVSLLGGQLALFVPMGIGVREAIFLAFLGGSRPAALILIFTIIFRIQMAVGEVLLTFLILLFDIFKQS